MSSTSSGPFSEENDISGRVVKSIYVEDHLFDGQTQRTGQTMESCAAVRTELETASDSAEVPLSKSLSTSSNSYDLEKCYNKFLTYYHLPLLNEPQTVKSFRQHLQHNNVDYLAKFSFITVNSDKTEAHVYLPHEFNILPNHYILSIYDSTDIPLKSQSNTPIFLSTSHPQPTYQPLDLNICTHNVRGYNTDLKQQIWEDLDRKSTRLNSSHMSISY